MDPTILQFVAGMVAGTIGGLVIVRRRSSVRKLNSKGRMIATTSSLKTRMNSTSSANKARVNSAKSFKAKHNSIPASGSHTRGKTSSARVSRSKNPTVVVAPIHHHHLPQATLNKPIPSVVVTPVATTVAISPQQLSSSPTFSKCPTCGLEAPEGLLTEHFMQSPSHRNPRIEPPIIVAIPTSQSNNLQRNGSSDVEEDSKLSFRNLLQILVPPRAFGHRAQQRTVNPLSKMVQAIEVASPRVNQQ